jgi:hypothetical protein
MNKLIAPVVRKVNLHQLKSDFSYWQKQPYEDRIAALEEIRREYHAWVNSQEEEATDVQSGFQRVYRIGKRYPGPIPGCGWVCRRSAWSSSLYQRSGCVD